MSKNIHYFNDSNFKEDVIDASTPVLVDFFAEWCAPCRYVSPIVEEIAEDYADQIKVGKVNVDENPGTAGQYGVSSIPTILLYKDGKVVDGMIGAVPKDKLKTMIDKHVPANE